jgi:transposase
MSDSNGIFMEMCARRPGNGEFNEIQKALIVREIELGRTYRDVATDARCSPSTVYDIFQRWKTQRTLDKKRRPGRPQKLSLQQIRYVLLSLKGTGVSHMRLSSTDWGEVSHEQL